MTTIIIPEGQRYIYRRHVPVGDEVFLDGLSLPTKLLGLSDRQRGTSPGETVGHMADGSPLAPGIPTGPLPHQDGIHLSPDAQWKYCFVIDPVVLEAMLLADSELPPEEQKLTGLERAALAVLSGQSIPFPEEWENPE